MECEAFSPSQEQEFERDWGPRGLKFDRDGLRLQSDAWLLEGELEAVRECDGLLKIGIERRKIF